MGGKLFCTQARRARARRMRQTELQHTHTHAHLTTNLPESSALPGGVTLSNMPRCWYCSSLAISAMLRMGPAGTRASLRTRRMCSLSFSATHLAMTCVFCRVIDEQSRHLAMAGMSHSTSDPFSWPIIKTHISPLRSPRPARPRSPVDWRPSQIAGWTDPDPLGPWPWPGDRTLVWATAVDTSELR